MPEIDSYRKRAKQLVRCHRERNHSVGEKARLLARYRGLRDVEVLDMEMPLTLAQEIVAAEAGLAFASDQPAKPCQLLRRTALDPAVAPPRCPHEAIRR